MRPAAYLVLFAGILSLCGGLKLHADTTPPPANVGDCDGSKVDNKTKCAVAPAISNGRTEALACPVTDDPAKCGNIIAYAQAGFTCTAPGVVKVDCPVGAPPGDTCYAQACKDDLSAVVNCYVIRNCQIADVKQMDGSTRSECTSVYTSSGTATLKKDYVHPTCTFVQVRPIPPPPGE